MLLILLALIRLPATAAVHTWSGAGANTNWSNAANWSSGGVPTAGEVALELVFPAAVPVASKSNVDNIPGLVVDVMTVDGGSYHFFGQGGATLSFSGKRGFNFIAKNTTNSSDQIDTFESSLPLVLPITSRFDANYFVEISSVISGAGGLAIYGLFTFKGTADNTYQGTTTVALGGGLRLAKTAGKNGFAGPLIVDEGNVENFANDQIPNNVSVTVQNDGTYHNANFTEKIGSLTLENGRVGSAATGGSTLTLLGDVSVTGTFSSIHSDVSLGGVNRNLNVAAGARLEILGDISDGSGGVGGITKTGLGELWLEGTNSYGGVTIISAGSCNVNQSAALGSSAGGTTVAADATLILKAQGNTGALTVDSEPLNLAGTFHYVTNVTWTGPVILTGLASKFEGDNSPFGAAYDLTLTGKISGNGQFTKMGGGRLDLLGSSNNTFTGGTVLNQGDIYLGNSNFTDSIPGALTINAAQVYLVAEEQINDNAAVTFTGGGLLDLGSRTETIGSLAGGSGATVHMALGTLIAGQNDSSTVFAGKFTGHSTVSIAKNGFGVWQLTNPGNTLTGKVYVNYGTLTVDGTEVFDVIVEPNGLLNGIGTVAGITNSGGKVCLCTLHSGNLNMTGLASQILTSLDNNINFDHISVTGTIQLTGSTLYASLPLGYAPFSDSSYKLIDNDGNDPIVGTFTGLPEGQLLLVSGKVFRITYLGGSGNDVVLTLITPGRVRPRITQFTVGPSGQLNLLSIQIQITSEPNSLHQLYYSADLLTWNAHPGKLASTDAQGHLTFTVADQKVNRFFYRVEEQ